MPRSSAQGSESFMVRGLFHTQAWVLRDDVQAGDVLFHERLDVLHGLALPCAAVSLNKGKLHAVIVFATEHERAFRLFDFGEGTIGPEPHGIGKNIDPLSGNALFDGNGLCHPIIFGVGFNGGGHVRCILDDQSTISSLHRVFRFDKAGLQQDVERLAAHKAVQVELKLFQFCPDERLALVESVAGEVRQNGDGFGAFDMAQERAEVESVHIGLEVIDQRRERGHLEAGRLFLKNGVNFPGGVGQFVKNDLFRLGASRRMAS